MTSRILGALLVLVSLSTLSTAQQAPRGKWFVEGFVGRSIAPFLGSKDHRSVYGIGFGHIRHTPSWLHMGRTPSELFSEIYYHRSWSRGTNKIPADTTDAIGILTTVRYWDRFEGSTRAYFEIGSGFLLANRTTSDNTSRLNSTPVIGLGVAFQSGASEVMVGVRMLHISNAGFRGTNRGQNQFMLVMGIRF